MTVPAHVAIIMDGNGRWASQRGKPRHAGHREGVKATRAVIEASAARGVKMLTLYAFSSENWRRPRAEVVKLMELFMDALDRQVHDMHDQEIRLTFIGDRARFSRGLQSAMKRAEALTGENARMCVNVAVSYGGRWEIVEAAKALARDACDGLVAVEDIDEDAMAALLCLDPAAPEPDLFIRTGGEKRLSNFLLWHLAYTELYFTDTLWPEFDADALDDAIDWFAGRERRFGTIDDA